MVLITQICDSVMISDLYNKYFLSKYFLKMKKKNSEQNGIEKG